jgi:palmitoyltransferase ZDHHC2/15/20
MLMLSFAGCAFTLVMGSFLGYHIYLVLCVFLLPSLSSNKHTLTSKRSSFLPLFPLPPPHNSTNQTTLEHISPFHLLRHLPPLPSCRLSSPPQQHQLAFSQRRAVRAAHSRLRLYDVGWQRNTAQVFGTLSGPKRRWFAACAARLLWGGSSCGTGTRFPRNPHAEDVLVDLAAELVRLENND